MRGSAVSQSSRRFKQEIFQDKKLKKIVERILKKIDFVEC
jgi:uncharacterized protein involved in type VI secretion and phage assembly